VPVSGFEVYHELRRRALWARIALATMVAVDLVAVLSDLSEYFLLQRMETEDVPFSEIEASDNRQLVVTVVQTAVFFAAAFFFIRWLHHAYRNLRPLGAKPPWRSRKPSVRLRHGGLELVRSDPQPLAAETGHQRRVAGQ